MISLRLRFWITHKKADEWIENKKIFFILATGRSGTQFLSSLLNKSPGAYVVHEPVREDFRSYEEVFYNEKKAHKYIQGFRKKEIYDRAREREIHTYGEVNSVLRRHCNALKKSFPNAQIFHLIRDGRDVVRSSMSRGTMLANHPSTQKIRPTPESPWKDKWNSMTQFEKICWYWDVENCYLNESIKKTLQFEKLISSYEYFKEHLLDPLEFKISKETWQKEVHSPKNITSQYTIPHWSEWDKREMDAFNEICGDTMRANGYE
jgi:hypothetical protein